MFYINKQLKRSNYLLYKLFALKTDVAFHKFQRNLDEWETIHTHKLVYKFYNTIIFSIQNNVGRFSKKINANNLQLFFFSIFFFYLYTHVCFARIHIIIYAHKMCPYYYNGRSEGNVKRED